MHTYDFRWLDRSGLNVLCAYFNPWHGASLQQYAIPIPTIAAFSMMVMYMLPKLTQYTAYWSNGIAC